MCEIQTKKNKEVIVLKNMSVNIAKSSSSRLLTIFTFHLSHHMPYHVDLTYDIYIHIYMCHMSTSVISYLFPTVSRFIPYKSSESLPSGDGNQEKTNKKTQSKTKTKIWCGFGCWAEERIFYQVIWVRSSIYSWVKSFQKIQTFHGQEILKRFKVVITCTAYNIWTLFSSLLNLHTPNKPHPPPPLWLLPVANLWSDGKQQLWLRYHPAGNTRCSIFPWFSLQTSFWQKEESAPLFCDQLPFHFSTVKGTFLNWDEGSKRLPWNWNKFSRTS